MGGEQERRLNENSARKLAKMVFLKYDDDNSGLMSKEEAANLITDLYASINIEYKATLEEGLEFMTANDSDLNQQFNREDFEQMFVRHLSTENNYSGFNLFGDSTAELPSEYSKPQYDADTKGHFHRDETTRAGEGYRSASQLYGQR